MARTSSRFRRIVLGGLAVLAAGLAVLHLYYPLPYVYRVLVYQDSDFSDIHLFPARSVAPSDAVAEWPLALEPGVAAVLEQHPKVERVGDWLAQTQTTAFLVVHQGRLVEERYLQGHDHTTVQNTFSVAKSVTSALVGIAVRDGVVELGDPITKVIPELAVRDERFSRITVEHLLNMRSGIRYSRRISFPFVDADDPLIYYHPDLESILLQRMEVASEPGDFQYNNYNPPLLGLILRRATGIPPAEYLERELWKPMGASRAAGWTVDDHGFERMESGFFACGRDLARFGMLYLDHGVTADGRRILPEQWVLDSTQAAELIEVERYDGRRWGYRLGWWIVPRAEGRPDFCAIGRYGQFIYVSPQYEAVFIRTGPGRGDWGDRDWTELFFFAAERLGSG